MPINITQPPQFTFTNGDSVPTVSSTTYLGALFKDDNSTRTGLTQRLGKTTAAFNSLKAAWRRRLGKLRLLDAQRREPTSWTRVSGRLKIMAPRGAGGQLFFSTNE
jgi:hypothetical protein